MPDGRQAGETVRLGLCWECPRCSVFVAYDGAASEADRRLALAVWDHALECKGGRA